MALVVTPQLTDISMCESITGWAGGSYLDIETGVQTQGTYCLSDWINATTGVVEKYTLGVPANMSNGEHLYVWLFCSGKVDTKANGGYRLYAETDASNYSTWYVGGNDTHPAGGWNIMCVALNATRTAGLGTLNLTSIAKIGVQFKTLTAAPIKGQTRFNNCFWDAVRYGTGLKITSGTSDGVTIADIFAIDDNSTYKYGVITKPSNMDAYLINGRLIIGDQPGVSSVDFVMDTQAVAFPQNDLMGGANGIIGFGNSTGTTNILINGSYIASYGVPFVFDFSDTAIDSCEILGNTIVNSSAPTFISGQTVENNVFSGCGTVYPAAASFTSNTIKESSVTAGIALYMAETNAIQNTSYLNNYYGFGVNPAADATAYNEDSGYFNGNTADIYNMHVSNAVTINSINYSNIATSATAGGTVTIALAPVTTVVTVKALSTGAAIENARVYLTAATGGPLTTGTVIFNTLTNVSGTVTDQRSLSYDQPVVGWVRHASSPYYKNSYLVGTINYQTGLLLTAQMVLDV